MFAHCMVCLHEEDLNPTVNSTPKYYQEHKKWLNNLRLVISVLNATNFIKKWIKVFPLARFLDKLTKLFNKVNQLDRLRYLVNSWDLFCFSSAWTDGRRIERFTMLI